MCRDRSPAHLIFTDFVLEACWKIPRLFVVREGVGLSAGAGRVNLPLWTGRADAEDVTLYSEPVDASSVMMIMTLGADTLPTTDMYAYTLTRLHARYGKGALGDVLGVPAGERFIVRHLGGEVDGIGMRVHGEASYRVGETVTPDSWDEDRWEECASGIHFFITPEEAVDYAG